MKPKRTWKGNREFQFEIEGYSDATWASDPDTRKSISGTAVILEGSPVSMKSGQINTIALSATEAELMSATMCAQDMLYTKRTLESLGLRVRLPMILYVDNRGAVDLANNWNVSGRTRHIEVRQYFLRQLKETNQILVRWTRGSEMIADLFTKNLPTALFEKYSKYFVKE